MGRGGALTLYAGSHASPARPSDRYMKKSVRGR